MSTVQLAQATVDDLSYLADVCESIGPMYDPIMPGAFFQQSEKYHALRELPAHYKILIFYYAGERVGFLGYAPLTPEVLYLVAFYIHRDYQRRGFGGVALEDFCADLRGQGYREVVLLAHAQAEWALNFYRRHDFSLVTREIREICQYLGGVLAKRAIPRAVLMRRELV